MQLLANCGSWLASGNPVCAARCKAAVDIFAIFYGQSGAAFQFRIEAVFSPQSVGED